MPKEKPTISTAALFDLVYFTAHCKDPKEQYFPRGDGTYLNQYEVLTEIMSGTHLGRELGLTWERMRKNWEYRSSDQEEIAQLSSRLEAIFKEHARKPIFQNPVPMDY